MNKIFRVIWNSARLAYIVMSENTKSKGKCKSHTGLPRFSGKVFVLLIGTLGHPMLAYGELTPNTVVVANQSGKTNTYLSANGVPVINIDKANVVGMSHNKFTRYNVDINGLILNNGNLDKLSRQSLLAGEVLANENLINEALVILNEVVAVSRSSLAGYTEVVGGEADVIVANPYGITCSGCGFINTDRVTLTTGTPNKAANGGLTGFTVSGGDVLVNGSGMDVSASQLLNLVARAIKLDGQINTTELGEINVIAGLNQWTYGSRSIIHSSVGANDKPSYGIDTSALGGMYAGRIHLIASEAGVGVRMLGESAAGVGDFTIDANGQVNIQGIISAGDNVRLSTNVEDQNAISLTDAEVSAMGDIELTAAKGGASLTGGALTAGKQLNLSVASLSDTAGTAAIQDNNKRFAESVNLDVDGVTSFDGVSYGASNEFTGTFSDLVIDESGGATLYAGASLELSSDNDLLLNSAALSSGDNMTLNAINGSIETKVGANQGIKVSSGNLELNASDNFINAGEVTVELGSMAAEVGVSVANTGTLHAGQNISISAQNSAALLSFNNTGTLLSEQSLELGATEITNSGNIQGTQGSTVNAAGLTNTGVWIASDTEGQDAVFNLDQLHNDGTGGDDTGVIQSAGELQLNLKDSLVNQGVILAEGDLSVQATDAGSELEVNNLADGIFQSGEQFRILSTAGANNAKLGTQAGAILAREIELRVIALDNAGTLQSSEGMILAITNELKNTGTLLAKTALTATAETVNNTGILQADQGAIITAENLINTGKLIGSTTEGFDGTLNLATLSNSDTGTIQSSQDLNFNVKTSADNSGQILVQRDLRIEASDVDTTLALINQADAVMQAGAELNFKGTNNGDNVTLNTQAGTMLATDIDLKLSTLVNSGTLQSNQDMTLVVKNGLDNEGTILSKNFLTTTAKALNNSGILQTEQGTTITAESLENTGTLIGSILAGSATTLNLDTLTNSAAGTIQSGGDLNLNLKASADNSGDILAAADLKIGASDASTTLNLSNQTDAVMQADGLLEINDSSNSDNITLDTQAGTLLAEKIDLKLSSLNNTGTLQSNQDMSLAIQNSLSNSGTLLAKTTLDTTAQTVINSGTFQAKQGAAVTATSLENSGTLIGSDTAGFDATLNLETLTNSASGTIQSAQDLNLHLKTSVDNSGKLLADRDLLVDATDSASTLALTNQSTGVMQASALLTIKGTNDASNVTLDTQAGTLLGDQVQLTLTSLDNTGTVQAEQDIQLVLASSLNNVSKIIAGTDLKITSGDASTTLNVSNQTDAVIQAGGLLKINNSSNADNVTLDTQAGTLLAEQIDLKLSSLNNAGTLQSNQDMSLAIRNSLSNSGTLLAKTTLDTTAQTVINSGILQATQGVTLTATSLENSGTLIGSDTAGIDVNFDLETLTNSASGTIQSAQDLNLHLKTSADNSGKLLADRDLLVDATDSASTLALTNQSTGVMQASALLTIKGTNDASNVTLDTQAGTLLAEQLNLTLASLTNGGLIQAGATGSAIAITNTLLNDDTGSLILSIGGTGNSTVNANSLNNKGSLQASGNALLTIADELDNSGEILMASDLTLRGSDDAYTINTSGRMQSAGHLDIKGNIGDGSTDNDDVEAVNIGAGGVTMANSLTLNATSLTLEYDGNLDDGGMLSTLGSMDVNVNTLTLEGYKARIVAALSASGDANITLQNAFTNNGAVHSSDNLTFIAPAITNSNTGGFSALNALDLQATNTDLINSGALYAGQTLKASATGNLENLAGTGTIDSDGTIELSSGATFKNTSTINAQSDIAIDALTFRNEVPGGGAQTYTSTVTDTMTVSGSFGWPTDATAYYTKTTISGNTYNTPMPGVRPQIISGGDMTISNFTSAYNNGGVLAASSGTMTIDGSGTFTNDALSETINTRIERWEVYEDCGFLSCDDPITQNYSSTNSASTVSLGSAGIYADTLVASGFSLVNKSSVWNAATTEVNELGASPNDLDGNTGASTAASGANDVGVTTGASAVGGEEGSNGADTTDASSSIIGASTITLDTSSAEGVTTVSGAPAIAFGGLVITLPSNPNGYFVVNKSPEAKYLIETNPSFAVNSGFIGSDYLQVHFGYTPTTEVKRLGDSNYEAHLIRQQLIHVTGKNVLDGYENEAAQFKNMMDNAVQTATELGMVYGQAPSAEQLGLITEDMIWMIETEVAGQRVLTPVVYLAQATIDMIETGAVIAADDIDMDLESVENVGSKITAKADLKIKSKDDIRNTSGKIKGGNVSLESTQGSVINETSTQASGNENRFITTIGKTAGIEATNNLDITAEENIVVLGADVIAGGDAALDAADDITFDTIVDKTTNSGRSFAGGSESSVTTTTENNTGSNLQIGNNLKLNSGGDTTLAGSNAAVGGNLDAATGGDFNIVARQDKVSTQTETEKSGFGVGGGLYGTEITTTDDFKGTNLGSTLAVGGDAKIKSDGDMTLQGSELNIAGDGDIDATSINILDGLDEENSTTIIETTTFLSFESDETDSDSSSDSSSSSGKGASDASASAAASVGNESEVNLYKATTETIAEGKTVSVASKLNIVGNAKLKAKETLKIQGSEIDVGGDLALEGKDVTVLAGRNTEYSETQKDTLKIGFFTEAEAGADASAEASSESGANTGGKAGATANAAAGASSTIGVRTESESDSMERVTNTSSVIKSGGNMAVVAENEAKFVGATVEAGENLAISAVDIINETAKDTYSSTTSKTVKTIGIYLDGSASAGANASAGATAGTSGVSAGFEAGVEAKVEGGIGFKEAKESTGSKERSVTNVANSFKSGGDFSRKAEGNIIDQGTSIEAGGNIEQSATSIIDQAVQDTTFSEETSGSHENKIGVSAGAEASAGVNADTSGSVGASASASVSVGIKMSTKEAESNTTKTTKTAVTSKYKSGGNISSKSKEGTTLVGTSFEAAGDVNIEASSLNYKAAQDSSSSSTTGSSDNKNLGLSTGGIELGLDDAENSSEEYSTTAKTGSIKSGGNISIKTSDNTLLEGTNLEAGEDINIEAKALNVKAAKDTYSKTTSDDSSNFGLSLSTDGLGLDIGSKDGSSQEDSTTSKASQIKSGGKMNINTQGATTLEGTKLKAGDDINIEAKSVDFTAARDTSSNTAASDDFELGISVGTGGIDLGLDISDSASTGSSDTAKAGSIESLGELNISTEKDTSFEGTGLAAKNDINLSSEDGSITFDAAKSTSTSTSNSSNIGIGFSTGGGGKSNDKTKAGKKNGSNTANDTPSSTGSGTNGDTLGGTKQSTGTTDSLGDQGTAADNSVTTDTLGSTDSAANGNANGGTEQSAGTAGKVGGANAPAAAAPAAEAEEEEPAGPGLSLDIGFNNSDASSTTNTVSGIRSGSGKINISAKKKVSLEGTKIQSKNDTNISAATVELKEAKDVSSSQSDKFGIKLGASSEGAEFGLDLNFSDKDKETGKGVDIDSGGKLNINAETVVNQEADLDAKEGKEISGTVKTLKKTSKQSGSSFDLNIEGAKKKKPKPEVKPAATDVKPAATNVKPVATDANAQGNSPVPRF
jgi:filamentous hemagglutinin